MSSLRTRSPIRWKERVRANWRRLNGPSRIAGVDLARGLAVVGMFAAHLLLTADRFVWTEPATWTAVVDGRSSILFATLAGVSIGLVTGGTIPFPDARMTWTRWKLVLRALLLLILGILLIFTGVPVYVILPAYAILFLLALPFTRLRASTVLWTAAGLAVVMPFLQPVFEALPVWEAPFRDELNAMIGWQYPFTVWIAFVLAGLGVARAGVTRLVVQWRMLVVGVVLATVGYQLAELPAPAEGTYWEEVWTADPHSSGALEAVGSGGFAIAVLAACLLLTRMGVLRMLTLPLRATGALPLTAYAVQLLVWAVVALITVGDTTDYLGFIALEPFWPMTIGMLIGCTAWALLIGRGPLEWLLERATRAVGPGTTR
ncbi:MULTISPECIES: heparan-alpha-glucosaminide N-acetyltransferase domain-containing protein [Microbacterium]|uniref:heparan-alpha-glucosaminide N-acetyltransferase domain-containing protein n=1 Tax=Microbacterium TaxID=33882 RepID=UPI0019D0713D|nr:MULTISPECIES: heparan-alpha-glucosaminide N-acetyltransferase domain-containing protein [Microbacterium]MCE7482332.1 heparan-alpha-glucosaminide N-acetyltransferase domain-containing protein [Microbacterium profundi]